jgi:hypothetical protein
MGLARGNLLRSQGVVQLVEERRQLLRLGGKDVAPRHLLTLQVLQNGCKLS